MTLPASAFTVIESGWLVARELEDKKLGERVYLEGFELRKSCHGKTTQLN